MQIQPQKLKYEFKRSFCMGLALFIFVVICAGCATQTPPPEQKTHIQTQSDKNSGVVIWSK